MVPGGEFWQTCTRMQNAPEAGAETPISAVPTPNNPPSQSDPPARGAAPASPPRPRVREIGGPPGPEPTRFGDWENKGRCIDF